MNEFFNGKGATDKGSLFHLKNTFNHRNVQKKVSSAFNHVFDFIEFVTEGYVCVLAIKILGIPILDDSFEFPKKKSDRSSFLHDIASKIVTQIWHDPVGYDEVLQEETTDQDDVFELCFCQTGIWFDYIIYNY